MQKRRKKEQWSRFWAEAHNEAHDVEAHDREAHGRKLLLVQIRIRPASSYWRMSRQPNPRDQPHSDDDVFVVRRKPRPKSANTPRLRRSRERYPPGWRGFVSLPFSGRLGAQNGEAFRGSTLLPGCLQCASVVCVTCHCIEAYMLTGASSSSSSSSSNTMNKTNGRTLK